MAKFKEMLRDKNYRKHNFVRKPKRNILPPSASERSYFPKAKAGSTHWGQGWLMFAVIFCIASTHWGNVGDSSVDSLGISLKRGQKLTTDGQLPTLARTTKTLAPILAPTRFSRSRHWPNTVGANVGPNVCSQENNFNLLYFFPLTKVRKSLKGKIIASLIIYQNLMPGLYLPINN